MELTSLVRAAKGSREQQVKWVTGGHGNLSLLPPCSCQPGWTHGNGKQFQGQGWRGLEPLWLLTLPGQRDRAGGHRYLRDTALLTPPLQQQGIFLTAKKKNKVQAKTVINSRANSEESGQSHGSAAPTRTSTASLEVTGSTGGITAPHPTPNLFPAQSHGTRGSAFLPLFSWKQQIFPKPLANSQNLLCSSDMCHFPIMRN